MITSEDINKIIEHLTVQSIHCRKDADEYNIGVSVGLDEAIFHLNELLKVEKQVNPVQLLIDGILG